MSDLTQGQLKELLHYEPDTGVFTWIKGGNGRRKIAGTRRVNGYSDISVNNKKCLAHRLAWLYVHGEWPKDQIDHINHARDDNRLVNLRSVSGLHNQRNTSISKINTSGVTGVTWHAAHGKWVSHIGLHGKRIHLGGFGHIFDAVCARKSAELKYNFHENHGMAKQALAQSGEE